MVAIAAAPGKEDKAGGRSAPADEIGGAVSEQEGRREKGRRTRDRTRDSSRTPGSRGPGPKEGEPQTAESCWAQIQHKARHARHDPHKYLNG